MSKRGEWISRILKKKYSDEFESGQKIRDIIR